MSFYESLILNLCVAPILTQTTWSKNFANLGHGASEREHLGASESHRMLAPREPVALALIPLIWVDACDFLWSAYIARYKHAQILAAPV